MPADIDPMGVAGHALESARLRAARDGVHSTAVAIDPNAWQLLYFTLWEASVHDDSDVASEVLHLSTPNLHMLSSAAETHAELNER